ncbi:MAG TPA: tetratricopeptide repeat protein [Planctomycetota bacterium]|nr:tetratricopeptide repeat protein [Planctomycetota bacterium]
MALALLLTLLVPVLQDDPQVTYREGLFEEVDQGNLEKAAELYGKILKGGAPDALKAKALLRTGFCHEKKGRKKEAEQAWRDVIERYPGAAETVKLARERLSRPEEEPSPRSTDDQIQKHIFNLGSRVDDNLRMEARRMLLFLGEPTIPHVRRALLNRDRMVSEGAAEVLMEMELHDGIYEALRRFWFPKGDFGGETLMLLPRLLEEYATDREKFLRDATPLLRNIPYMSYFAPVFVKLPDSRFTRILEDWLVETTEDITPVLEIWIQNRPDADVLRMLKRLNARTPPETGKAISVFHQYAGVAKIPDRDVKAECLAALGAAPDGTDYFENLKGLLPHFGVTELVQGPVASWLAKRPVDDKRRLLQSIASLGDMEEGTRTLLTECRKFLFEQLGSADVPLETKELILASGFRPDTPDEQAKFLAYCLHFWKEQGAKGGRKTDALMGVLGHLAYYLPPDSKELPAILDAAFDAGVSYPGMWGERPEERRPLVMATMHRSLKRDPAGRDRNLSALDKYGTPGEKMSIGSLLAELGPTSMGNKAARTYATGFRALDLATQQGRWGEVAANFEAGTQDVKSGIVQAISGMTFGPVDDLMKKELTSSNVYIRQGAINHWGARRGPEAMKQLMLALNDEYEHNQTMALHYLRATPSLDVVPDLIKLLKSPSKTIRDTARAMLVEFKEHFAAEAEWQRWYDETKKTLGK